MSSHACPLSLLSATSNQCPNGRTYSLSEMKTFKKVAKAIRNVDEGQGHAEATAAFIDSEFSDNSGRTLRALCSNSGWKKNRVNAICEKAAVCNYGRSVSCT